MGRGVYPSAAAREADAGPLSLFLPLGNKHQVQHHRDESHCRTAVDIGRLPILYPQLSALQAGATQWRRLYYIPTSDTG